METLIQPSHRSLVDHLPMAAYAVRAPDGVLVWFNSMAARLWGREPKIGDLDERFCGSYRLYRPDGSYMAHGETPIVEALKTGVSFREQDVIIERPDGSRITVCVYIDPIRDEQNKIVGVTNFFYDVTDRKAKENHIKMQAELLEAAVRRGAASEVALRKSEQVLREADRRKNEFLAMLAHELRNPLASIASSSELLSRNLSEDRRAQISVAIIRRQAAQLTRLVDDLLDVSRIAQGRIHLKRRNVDLATVITQAIETVEPMLHDNGCRLSKTLSSCGPLYVNGDPTRLVQCVSNVLNNAVKFTEPGGEISIRARGDERNAFIEIADSGAGITRESLPHIFEMFVQSDRTLARSGGGLGIGLALVKRLLEMHEGSVEARSGGLGQGSVFEIRLPRVSRPTAFLSEGARHRVGPLKVLVVDDNIDVANSLALLLKIHKHEVRVAHDGASALACVEGFAPDVGLVDLGLPEMSGYELASRLRKLPKLNGLRLIALTGYGQAEDRARTRQAGFDDHLTKPVEFSVLERSMSGVPAPAERVEGPGWLEGRDSLSSSRVPFSSIAGSNATPTTGVWASVPLPSGRHEPE